MAVDITRIFAGQALNIYVAVTNPATGTPPTLMTHTAGVPSPGTYIGSTEGDATLVYKATKTFIDIEQAIGHVDIFVPSEEATLTFTMKEHNATALKLAMDNIGNVDDGSKTLMYFGGNGTVIQPTKQSLFFSSVNRSNSSKYIIGLFYKATASTTGYKALWSRTKPGTIQVQIDGLLDLTRNVGDQMGQFFIEK